MILLVDTAATGMPRWDRNATADGQPHLVRLAMIEIDPADPNKVSPPYCALVQAPVRIDPEATQLHGIRDQHIYERSVTTIYERSVTTPEAFAAFEKRLQRATMVAGYSVDFHRRVLERTAGALDKTIEWPVQVCLMRAAAPVVKVRKQKNGQWAWPKMTEAYQLLMGKELERSPDPTIAGIETILAVADIYMALQNRGAVPAAAREAV